MNAMSAILPAAASVRLGPVAVVALVAAVLALGWSIWNLGQRPLWLDELFTLAVASPTTPPAEALGTITGDVHPPLYYFGIRAWLALLGVDSEWAARAFNLFPLAAAALGAFWAARAKVDAPMALWSAIFFTSFGVLWYLQEARMYAFLIFDCFLVCVIALIYEKQRHAAPTPAFIAASIAAFVILPFTHWFAALFAGLVLLGLFAIALSERRRAYALLFFLAGLSLAALALAWIAAFWSSTGGALSDYDSGASMEFWEIRRIGKGTLLFALTFNPILILAAAWAAFATVRAPRTRPALTLLLLCAALTPALILLVSLYAPMSQTRNFVGAVAPLTLLAALGLDAAIKRLNWSPTRAGLGLAAVLALNLALGASADRFNSSLERDQWREAGEYVRDMPGCAGAPIAISEYWSKRPANPDAPPIRSSQRIYAYYAGAPERFRVVYSDDVALPEGAGAGACPIAFWAGHLTTDEAEEIGRELLDMRRDEFEHVAFRGNSVFVRRPAAEPGSAP
jgi:hypothetical protein